MVTNMVVDTEKTKSDYGLIHYLGIIWQAHINKIFVVWHLFEEKLRDILGSWVVVCGSRFLEDTLSLQLLLQFQADSFETLLVF